MNIYFDVEETIVGTSTPFTVQVFVDASTSINAINLVLDLPETVSLVDSSDGNSIINLWVEKPVQKDNQVIISGLIPGGFRGMDAKLVELKLQATQIGKIAIGINDESVAYKNDGGSTEEKIEGRDLSLTVEANKTNIIFQEDDFVPPESFRPEYINLSDNEDSPNWAVAFFTQDKGSGVDHYEVAESKSDTDLTWKIVDSPYILSDQERRLDVYVKAVDNAGNERIEVISPQSPWSIGGLGYIIILAFIVFGLYAIFSKKNK